MKNSQGSNRYHGIACAFLALIASLISPGALAAQCSDNIDNNSDGLIDMASLYCKAPDDNDESSFHSGAPGDDTNLPHALDTWFDLDSGPGNDGCQIHACCMIEGTCPADLEPQLFNAAACSVTQNCIDNATPLTKSGCDCFGCCEVCNPETSLCANVFLNPVVSPNCSAETLGDPLSCRTCKQNTQCFVPAFIFRNGFELPSGQSVPAVLDIARAMTN